MSKTATQYLSDIAPQFNERTNTLELSEALVTDNVIAVSVNGGNVSAVWDTDSDTTLNNLKISLLALPQVETVELTGLVFTITTPRNDILLSGSVTGGASQADVTIGELDTELRDAFIETARLQTNACWYTIKYEYAVALRAAHLLTLQAAQFAQINSQNGSAVNGEVESLTQGDLTVKYKSVSDSGGSKSAVTADLSRTPFGTTLLSLRKSSNISMMSSGSMSRCQ